MFKIFANAWRVEDIRRKLLFVFLLLLIFRFGSAVPLPGINLELLDLVRGGGGGFDQDIATTIFSLIVGGGIGSLFAMGIAPYITASIIMQLLSYAIPYFSELKNEGEEGNKKIQQITRYLAVGLAVLQAAATVFSYTNWNQTGYNLFRPELQGFVIYAIATLAMTSGTIFIMWLAELITEKGIGQGASFLIFANILAALPGGAMALWMMITDGSPLVGLAQVVGILVVFVAMIIFVIYVHEGERRIPVQYAKRAGGTGRGAAQHSNHNSFIPIKVNLAGVLSIIFAMSLLQFPQQIAGFFGGAPTGGIGYWIFWALNWNNPVGLIIYIVLIFMFTHFYTSFAVNPREMAENMKKNGGFIPGIRPGQPTSEFIQTTVNRLSWIGAVFYSLIAVMPILLEMFIPGIRGIGFGGTSLLIVTGVALEFVKQLESQLLMRHYKGFLD
ncbi:MAG: preprotein translocase subunit SecY [Defluviitaleaceae bacterium]|nr:preprotein translocase subunit SecY [Defluviitaleaceae bacterium]